MGRRYGRLRRPRRHSRRRISTSTDSHEQRIVNELCSSTVSADGLPRRSDVPRYRQLADALEAQIDAGTYRPGERVPSVRRLRQQHGVSVTTVLEALRVLEDRGRVRSRPRSGYFVERAASTRRGREPEPASPTLRARRLVDAALSVKLNLGIGNPQHPTLGAAVQGPELMPITALNRLIEPGAAPPADRVPLLRRPAGQPGAAAGGRPPGTGRRLRRRHARRGRRHQRREGGRVPLAGRPSPARATPWRSRAPPTTRCSRCWRRSTAGGRGAEPPARRASTSIALARVLDRHDVAAVAMVSNFSNPTGSCMTDERKRAPRRPRRPPQVPLVEDDVYGDLAFDGSRPTAVKAFDRERPRPLLRLVQQVALARAAGRVGAPRSVPDRGRAPEAGRQPGDRHRAAARGRPPSSRAAGSTATCAASGPRTARRWSR